VVLCGVCHESFALFGGDCEVSSRSTIIRRYLLTVELLWIKS
jgi:hypothetical protein